MVNGISGLDGVDAAVNLHFAKHVVDCLQDRRSRAERVGERDRIEFQSGVDELPLQQPAARVEFAGRGALKGKDRLFLVTDREDRTLDALTRALAGRELGNDMSDNVPLLWAGVLRLVDQHVINAAIELVMHPARGYAIQHLQRLLDQVIIVEQPALLLFALVVRSRYRRDLQQRLCSVPYRQRASALDQGPDAQAFRVEQSCDYRIVVAEFLAEHGVARRAIVGKKYVQICIHLRAAGKDQSFPQTVRLLSIGFTGALEDHGDFFPPGVRQMRSIDDLALDGIDRIEIGRAHV